MKNTLYYTWLLVVLFIANSTLAQQPQSHLWSLPNQQVDMDRGNVSVGYSRGDLESPRE